MGLRQQAAADLATIVEDTVGGFGWPITVTDPDGAFASLVGLSTDIGHMIDAQTGQAISGRMASVALRISALTAAGLSLPYGVTDETKRPWVVSFADINGVPFTFKVTETRPDRALGLVVCLLEAYQDAAPSGVLNVELGGGDAGKVRTDEDDGTVETS